MSKPDNSIWSERAYVSQMMFSAFSLPILTFVKWMASTNQVLFPVLAYFGGGLAAWVVMNRHREERP
jgi:hypothetical protein